MDKDIILAELAKFFIEEFENNPIAIGDWVAQGDVDVDDFIAEVRKIVILEKE